MKPTYRFALFSAASLLGHVVAEAGTAVHEDPASGGITYYWTVNMGASDTTSIVRHVGAWSWQDSALFSPGETPVGWTHNSDWIALKLDVTTTVTIRVQSKAGVSLNNPTNPDAVAGTFLIPAMTIYSGWDNDLAPQSFADANNGGSPIEDWHAYVNRGSNLWAEDTTYFTHLEPNGTSTVEMTMLMPAGEYSLVVGGNANSTENPGRQGYEVTVTTSAAVPEPASGGLLMLGGLGFLARRHRAR